MTTCTCDTFLTNVTIDSANGSGAGLLIIGDPASLQIGTSAQAGLAYDRATGDLYLGGENGQDGDFYIRNLYGTVILSLRADGSPSVQIGPTALAGVAYDRGTGDFYVGGDNDQPGDFYIKDASGTNQIGLRSDGASYLLAGNLGIGTNSPAQSLDVVASANENDSIRLQTGNPDGGLRLSNTSTGGVEWYIDSAGSGSGYGAGNLVFVAGVGGGPLMTLTPGGSPKMGTRTVADASGFYYA